MSVRWATIGGINFHSTRNEMQRPRLTPWTSIGDIKMISALFRREFCTRLLGDLISEVWGLALEFSRFVCPIGYRGSCAWLTTRSISVEDLNMGDCECSTVIVAIATRAGGVNRGWIKSLLNNDSRELAMLIDRCRKRIGGYFPVYKISPILKWRRDRPFLSIVIMTGASTSSVMCLIQTVDIGNGLVKKG